jgi:hypothetical protein
MAKNIKVRMNWLKGMYIYTIICSGGFGLGMLFMRDTLRSLLGWAEIEPLTYGIAGSVYVTFGILSIFGLKAPLKFIPVLLSELIYKVIWLIVIMLPLLITNQFPSYGIMLVVFFVTFIIGNLIAIPFSYIFDKKS